MFVEAVNAEEHLETIRTQEKCYYCPLTFQIRDDNLLQISEYLSWRQDMASWLVDTSSLYDIRWETVEVALTLLDRFAAVDKDITEDFELFQLACFVCFLMACKTQETKRMVKRSKIHELTRGDFSQEEFDCMELHILFSLRWLVHPPTASRVSLLLFELIPHGLLPDQADVELYVLQQLKAAILDASFLPYRATSIALAAILNALEPILREEAVLDIRKQFEKALGFSSSCGEEAASLQSMLSEALEQSLAHHSSSPANKSSVAERPTSDDDASTDCSTVFGSLSSSPRSVVLLEDQ